MFPKILSLVSSSLSCFLLCRLHSQAGPLHVVSRSFRLTPHLFRKLGGEKELFFNIPGKVQGLILVGALKLKLRVCEVWFQKKIRGWLAEEKGVDAGQQQ